jgi:hypothetical protein
VEAPSRRAQAEPTGGAAAQGRQEPASATLRSAKEDGAQDTSKTSRGVGRKGIRMEKGEARRGWVTTLKLAETGGGGSSGPAAVTECERKRVGSAQLGAVARRWHEKGGGVADGVGVPLGVGELEPVGEGVGVEVEVGVLEGEGSNVGDWLGVLVAVGETEGVRERLGVAVGVTVPVGEGVCVEEKLTVGVKLGVLLEEGS